MCGQAILHESTRLRMLAVYQTAQLSPCVLEEDWIVGRSKEIMMSLAPESPHCRVAKCLLSSSEHIAVRSPSENCARIKKLGYIVGKRMNLYGEHFELVSDPFDEGDCVAVHAISTSNPAVRTIELPVSILAGWEDLFEDLANSTGSKFAAKAPLPDS